MATVELARPVSAAVQPGALPASLLELADDDRSQEDRHPVHRHHLRLLPARRSGGADGASPARTAGGAAAQPEALQPDLHGPRLADDLPLHHPDSERWLRQLPRAAHDRRARHGLPRLNALSFWMLPVARGHRCCPASSSGRPTRAGRPTRRCRCGPPYGQTLWLVGVLILGNVVDPRRHQLPGHDFQHARPRA